MLKTEIDEIEKICTSSMEMTVNRLTDEKLNEYTTTQVPRLPGFTETFQKMAQELLTLRKENEMLRNRVEVGESLYRNADCLQVNHLKICFQETEDCYCGLIDLDESCKKWRESENQNES